MKKQNVKLILLASLLTGLLSQGAMAATSGQGTTIYLSADVSKTTCNVSSTASGGVSGGVTLQDLGTFNKADLVNGVSSQVGVGNYKLTPSTTAPLVLTISNCVGDDLAAAGDELKMSAKGNAAYDLVTPTTANDLYGDPASDRGYGFALGFEITDNSKGNAAANNSLTDKTGFIVPSKGEFPIYKATAVSNTGDLDDMNISVKIVPQIAAWAATSANVQSGQLDTNVTFSVAMN